MPRIEPLEIVPNDGTRTTGGGPAPTIERDPDFYFDDILVIIKVENKLFRVHKYQLLESETFSDMFKVPKGSSNEVEEGSSPERPIALDGVSSSDFAALLKVLYTRHFLDEHPTPEASLLVPALRLAHMWNFAGLRKNLLPLAKKVLGDADKIVLARELGIRDINWLVPAYMELCRRQEPLNIEEATKLGVHSLLMISHLREQLGPRATAINVNDGEYYCSSCYGVSYSDYFTSCMACHSGATQFRMKDGARIPEQSVDTAKLETEVKKWVEAGCVFTK